MTLWYEDDDLWTDFAGALFSASRATEAAEAVATSPLLKAAAGMRVLDLACGPGTHVVPLARQGAQVTGVDISRPLLDRARSACEAAGVTAELVRADMRDYVAPGAFDLIVNMYTSFGYFTDPDDNLRVLRNAHASLAPGGRLLVDLMGKEVYAGWVGPPKVVDVDGGTVVMRDTILDDWTRFRTDWTLVRGDTVRRSSLELYVYSAAEMRSLLRAAGFAEVTCYGDLDGSPYDNHARRLVVQATRTS